MRRPSAGPARVAAAFADRVGVWLVLPWLLVGVVALIEVSGSLRHDVAYVGSLLSPAPALAAIRGGVRDVLAVSAAAVTVALAVAVNYGLGPDSRLTALAAVVLVGAASLLATTVRVRRDAQLTRIRRVAEAAQQAVLVPVPPRAGPLRLAAGYSAAESDALIGGDLYEVVVLPDRTRLIIGDVRGKGLPAIRTAAAVLGAFREAAHYEAALPTIADHCSRAVERCARDEAGGEVDEVFATAVLLEIEGPVLRVVDLGHPPPLLITPDGPRPVASADPLPPLGLVHRLTDDYPVHVCSWSPGNRLLLYTDGIDEARDDGGRFFPLADSLHALRAEPVEHLPCLLLEAVARYTGRVLRDDAAVVAVEFAEAVRCEEVGELDGADGRPVV